MTLSVLARGESGPPDGHSAMRMENYGPPPIEFRWADKIGDEAALEGAEEIVEDILTAGSMSVWYGPPGTGKTTLLLDMTFHLTAGATWLGKRTVKGVVLYIALEGRSSVERRLVAYRKHHGRRVFNFGLISSSLNLMDPSADVEDLLELIRCKMSEFGPTEAPLRLIVVDTLARAMAGANENAGEDMSRLVAAGDRIRQETGAHVAFVHHSGKDATKGARGHSSLEGATDAEIEVTADQATKLHTLCVEKQRDLGTKGMKLSARFRVIELGRNRRWPDKPITACVVEPVEPPSAHLQAVMAATARESAETAVVAGLRRLQAMSEPAVAGKNSPNYLPRKLVEMNLANGFDMAALAAATNDLRLRGVLVSGTVGQYANRTPMPGLVVGST